jgi:hypothetical protein
MMHVAVSATASWMPPAPTAPQECPDVFVTERGSWRAWLYRAGVLVAAGACLGWERAVAQEEGVEGDSLIGGERPPEAHPWERLTFFPALRDIDREFDQLMLRAAYAGDVEWGAQQVGVARARSAESLEQEILLAEQAAAEARASFRICNEKAQRAERLLRKYEAPTEELKVLERQVLDELKAAHEQQDAIWERLRRERVLDRDAWDDWEAVYGAIVSGRWSEAWARHQDLERYHPIVLGKVELTDEEEQAFRGARVDAALQAVVDLAFNTKYRAEELQRKRYADALKAVRAKADCEMELFEAERFVQERRKKRLQLQIAASQGSADALEHDASLIADRYGAVLAEVQLVDAYLSNEVWASLWWKAGVALRLAGEHELGARRIAQAAAVATGHRLPSGVVPPSLETWLREGENEVLREAPGLVHVVAPPTSTVTVDGREIKSQLGEATLSIAAGIHRFVFWVEGSDPIMRMVSVLAGGDHELVWYQRTPLNPDDVDLFGEELVLPPLARERKAQIVFIGVSGRGGATLGRAAMGVEATVRILPKWIGGQIGAAIWVPFEPYWLTVRRDLDAYARLHGAVVARHLMSRVHFGGALGAYVDPLLGAGPLGLVEFGWKVRRGADDQVRLVVDVRAGYDVTTHFEEIPRWMVEGGLGVSF